MAKSKGNIHGALVIDKPEGPTSHDVVARCRRIFGTRRIGHAGTLDPMATGVLVVLLGEATKLSAVLTRATKTYEAEVSLGTSTDSLDRTGKITRKKELPEGIPTNDELARALEVELYREAQVPPLVSALKVEGRRAYELAREGSSRELAPRDVLVHGLTLLERNGPVLKVRLTVSKGYYVRAFARDLGDSLGIPAHLSSLRRTASGAFDLAGASPFPPEPNARLLDLREAVSRSLPTVELNEEGALRALQGKLLTIGDHTDELDYESHPLFDPADPAVAALHRGRLAALLEPSETQRHFVVRRGFVRTEDDEPSASTDETSVP